MSLYEVCRLFWEKKPNFLPDSYNSPTRAYSEAKVRNILTNDTSLSLCHIKSRFAIVTILSRCQCHKLYVPDIWIAATVTVRDGSLSGCQCRDYGGTRLTPHSAPAAGTGGTTITKHCACVLGAWCHSVIIIIACDISPAKMMMPLCRCHILDDECQTAAQVARAHRVTRSLDSRQHTSVSVLYFLVV